MHGRRNIRTSGHLNMAFSDIVYDSSVGLYSSFELRHLKIPPSRLRTFARFAASGRPKMLRYLKPQRDGVHEYADRRQGHPLRTRTHRARNSYHSAASCSSQFIQLRVSSGVFSLEVSHGSLKSPLCSCVSITLPSTVNPNHSIV